MVTSTSLTSPSAVRRWALKSCPTVIPSPKNACFRPGPAVIVAPSSRTDPLTLAPAMVTVPQASNPSFAVMPPSTTR